MFKYDLRYDQRGAQAEPWTAITSYIDADGPKVVPLSTELDGSVTEKQRSAMFRCRGGLRRRREPLIDLFLAADVRVMKEY